MRAHRAHTHRRAHAHAAQLPITAPAHRHTGTPATPAPHNVHAPAAAPFTLPRPCVCTLCARQLRGVWQPHRLPDTHCAANTARRTPLLHAGTAAQHQPITARSRTHAHTPLPVRCQSARAASHSPGRHADTHTSCSRSTTPPHCTHGTQATATAPTVLALLHPAPRHTPTAATWGGSCGASCCRPVTTKAAAATPSVRGVRDGARGRGVGQAGRGG